MESDGHFDLLQNPAYWSDRQAERQKRYYERGNRWRQQDDDDDDEDDEWFSYNIIDNKTSL